jgi:AraC-like DNA-binding protein
LRSTAAPVPSIGGVPDVAQDALSEVLRGVRLRGAVFFNISGSSDWAAEAPASKEIAPLLMPGVEHVIEYHAVARGRCWAGIPDGPWVQLGEGDVVLFPQGDAHVVASAPRMRGSGDLDWLTQVRAADYPLQISYDGAQPIHPAPPADGADATLVCGFLGCDLRPFNPLFGALPRLLHLRADERSAWMARFTQQAVDESRARKPGAEAMLARMSEMMFVDAVRRYADELPAGSSGWLAALQDRFVGHALRLVHEDPAHPWTIEELGHRVGLSRSTLHERFVELIGVPPMQYLAQWRMQAAGRLLLETRSPVASIALEVGYDSEAAFSRAFKRLVGKPPAAWRRERLGEP